MEPSPGNDNELFEEQPSPDQPADNGSSNRPFIIGVGILGAVVVLSIIAIIVYVILFRPRTTTDLANQAAEIQAQNTAISLIASQTAEFEQQQSTQKAAPSSTPVQPTATQVVPSATTRVITSTSVAAGQDPAVRTATVAAFQTQAAASLLETEPVDDTPNAQVTPTVQATPTELPTTGFMDEVGLPALIGAALALIVIIFLVRRLRFSTN